MERFGTAAILFERALKRNPENYVPLIPLAAAHAYLNRIQEAEATIEELQKALPIIVTLSTVRESPLWRYRNPKDKNRLLGGLRMAGMQGTPYDALRKAK